MYLCKIFIALVYQKFEKVAVPNDFLVINWRKKLLKGFENNGKLTVITIKNFKENDYMSVSFENTATNRGVVTFTIGQDKIQPALDQAFNKV